MHACTILIYRIIPCIFFEIIVFTKYRDQGVKAIRDHWKRRHPIDHIELPINHIRLLKNGNTNMLDLKQNIMQL